MTINGWVMNEGDTSKYVKVIHSKLNLMPQKILNKTSNF